MKLKNAEAKKTIGGYALMTEEGAAQLFTGKGAKKAAEDAADAYNAEKGKPKKKGDLVGSRVRGGGRGGRA